MKINDEQMQFFNNIASPIVQNETYLSLKKYIQHSNITTYDHCHKVALACYKFVIRFHLPCKKEALIRGCLLHDFCLYDWHDKNKGFHWHGFRHAKIASINAKKYFNVTKKEERMIRSHMWPLNLFHPPLSIEGIILCLIDKKVSFLESIKRKKKEDA